MTHTHIAIIGLGYVGLPLAVEFAKKYRVTGFDINAKRIDELKKGIDATLETHSSELNGVQTFSPFGGNRGAQQLPLEKNVKNGLFFTTELADIAEANIYIVTVPTPITGDKRPDMNPLIKASETVGHVIQKGDVIIYESTVYPGATEEVCLPVVEKVSGLRLNLDFFAGYSPERINPGDKVKRLVNIKKVTSGSTPEIAETIDRLYNTILKNGTHKASSIKVAEASKVIENAQRDLNISFVNELAVIFDRMGIDTQEVIEAAATKWNFLPFKPGLVGGHCISIDPYYLKWKAEQLGYHPDVISSGRRVNDNMGKFVAEKVIKLMIDKGHRIKGSKVLVLGFTYKENCPDIRNTKVFDVVHELSDFGCEVEVCDPWADVNEVQQEYQIRILPTVENINLAAYQALVLTVAHQQFYTIKLENIRKNNSEVVVYDLKGIWPSEWVDKRL
ncbi:MAG: nucleotide sugar dehydrogenase [Prolixibacteraceae bacterium]